MLELVLIALPFAFGILTIRYLIIKGAYLWMYRLLGYTAAKSPFRTSLTKFIHTYESPQIEAGMECLDCGSTAPKPTYELGRIHLQRCDACGAMVCSKQTLRQIMHHFGSTFSHLKTHPLTRQQKNLCVLVEANRIDRKKGIACFRLDDLNAMLEEMSRNVINKTEARWWCVKE